MLETFFFSQKKIKTKINEGEICNRKTTDTYISNSKNLSICLSNGFSILFFFYFHSFILFMGRMVKTKYGIVLKLWNENKWIYVFGVLKFAWMLFHSTYSNSLQIKNMKKKKIQFSFVHIFIYSVWNIFFFSLYLENVFSSLFYLLLLAMLIVARDELRIRNEMERENVCYRHSHIK